MAEDGEITAAAARLDAALVALQRAVRIKTARRCIEIVIEELAGVEFPNAAGVRIGREFEFPWPPL